MNQNNVSMEPQEPRPPAQGFKFSRDEMRVLEECNRESFFQRSLPFTGVLGFITYCGVKSGYLAPNRRFGAIPKVMLACTIGYFAGKVSYQEKCAEKIMLLPDSQLAEVLRRRKNKDFSDTRGSLSMYGAAAPDVYSDAAPNSQSSSLNLDTDRPTFRGLEESQKPSLDSAVGVSEEFVLPKAPGMTYDDLRRKNREESNAARSQPYRVEEPLPPVSRPRAERPATNQYGDTIN